MRLALIQTRQNALYEFTADTPLQTAEIAGLQREMLEQNYRLIETLAGKSCDLIITTEAVNYCGQPRRINGPWRLFITETEEVLLDRLSTLAKQAGSYLVAGMYRSGQGDAVHNAAVVFDRTGKEIGCCRKMHLAGEENEYLVPGDEPFWFDSDMGRVGVCICWDAQFPETHRMLAQAGARLVVCPTWGWEAIYGHARAYENGIHVAAAMAVPYRGAIGGIRTPSEVVGPDGAVLARASADRPEALVCDFDPAAQRELWEIRMSGRRPECYAPLTRK